MANLDDVLIKGTRNGKEVVFTADSLGTNIVLTNVPCESSVYIGAAVFMQSNGIAKNAIATSLTESNIIGIVEAKPGLNVCNIRVLGVTPDIFTGLDVSLEYFLSDTIPGGLQTSVPTTSGHVVLRVGQPFSDKSLLVLKGQRSTRL
jgi:hypothetical protein